jgi:hypothetical protein
MKCLIVVSQAFNPICICWLSSSVGAGTERATATAMVIAFGNIGGVLAPFVYSPENSRDFFKVGHLIMAGCLAWSGFWVIVLRNILKSRNERMEKSLEDVDNSGGAVTITSDKESFALDVRNL